MHSAWERFAAATVLLAGSGNIKDRLLFAYQNELAQLDTASLPDDVRAEYDEWHSALHRERPLRGEDAVRATLRKLSGAEADSLARTLVRISLRLACNSHANNDAALRELLAAERMDGRAAANGNGAAVVQLFPS